MRLGRRGRRHQFTEMDQGDRLLDEVLWAKMSCNLFERPTGYGPLAFVAQRLVEVRHPGPACRSV